MNDIEYGFRTYHPLVIFFYYLSVGILAMYLNHPILLFIACLIMIVVNITHDNGKTLKKSLPTLLVMSVAISILNVLFVSKGGNVIFSFLGKKVTVEAIVFSVVMVLSLSLLLLMFISFNLILNGNKFLFVFSNFLPRTAFLIMLTVRFVPLLKMRLAEIADVQRIKGIAITSGTFKERCKNGMILIQILLTWSLEEAIQSADSMKARGYGIGKRSSYMHYKMTRRDKFGLINLICLLLFCLTCGVLGYGRINIYPEIDPLTVSLGDVLVIMCTIMMVSFPLIVEGREQRRWKYLD